MGPFIPVELRPAVGASPDRSPPVAVQAPRAELERRARAVLAGRLDQGAGLRDVAGLDDIRVRRNPAVAWVTLGGESVLLHADTGVYYTLNRVAAVVWELLTGERTVADLVAALCGRFAIDARTARADLVALVADLRRADLLGDGPDGPPES